MDKTNIQTILSELTNVNLVILGISITIFTVIYSFLVNKRGDLNNITSRINNSKSNPFDNQQRYFALNYIKQFTSVNKKLLHLIILSFVLFISLFVFNRFLLDTFQKIKELIFYLFSGLTVFVLFYFIYVFYDLIKKYKNEVSI
jgi:hypothetical protein